MDKLFKELTKGDKIYCIDVNDTKYPIYIFTIDTIPSYSNGHNIFRGILSKEHDIINPKYEIVAENDDDFISTNISCMIKLKLICATSLDLINNIRQFLLYSYKSGQQTIKEQLKQLFSES